FERDRNRIVCLAPLHIPEEQAGAQRQQQLYNGSVRSLSSSNAHPRPIGGEGRGEGPFLVFSRNGKAVTVTQHKSSFVSGYHTPNHLRRTRQCLLCFRRRWPLPSRVFVRAGRSCDIRHRELFSP